MSYPVIPRGLRPSAVSYGFAAPESVLRTPVAGGRARYVQQWRGGYQVFSVSMTLDRLQFMVWDAFFLHKIGEGAITFQMYLDSGRGVSLHPCNILPGSYSAKRSAGVSMVVAFEVEARSQTWDMTDADVDSLLELNEAYGPALMALLRRLATFANSDTNALDF